MEGSTTKVANFGSGCFVDNDILATMMGRLVPQRTTANLMQNCDLPPPLKVFSWPENTSKMTHETGTYAEAFRTDEDKLQLLRALRSSQTRAREAEKRAEALAREVEVLSKVLIEDSTRLFAYRQWVKLLEIEVSVVRSKWQPRRDDRPNKEEDGGNGDCGRWLVSATLCLGIAGMGLALGLRDIF